MTLEKVPETGDVIAGRDLPVGVMWASRGDVPGPFSVISREWALDHGRKDWEKYPSWEKYPDARDISVGVEARRLWKVREARLLAEIASRDAKTDEVTVAVKDSVAVGNAKCEGCGEGFEARRSTAKYCSEDCRKTAWRART